MQVLPIPKAGYFASSPRASKALPVFILYSAILNRAVQLQVLNWMFQNEKNIGQNLRSERDGVAFLESPKKPGLPPISDEKYEAYLQSVHTAKKILKGSRTPIDDDMLELIAEGQFFIGKFLTSIIKKKLEE